MKSRIGTLALLAILASSAPLAGCTDGSPEGASDADGSPAQLVCALPPNQDPGWVARARVVPVSVDPWADPNGIGTIFRKIRADHASVALIVALFDVHADDQAFSHELDLLSKLVCLGHELGLRVAVRLPALAVRGPDAGVAAGAQSGIEGKPNRVAATDGGLPTAWMCPNGPYGTEVLLRAGRIAGTGIDALYLSDLAFPGEGSAWPCTCDHCARAFADWSRRMGLGGPKGLILPREVDFQNSSFRPWLRWRHRTLADFAERIARAVVRSNPGAWVFVEDHDIDNLGSTEDGLDASFFSPAGHLAHAWDVRGVSTRTGMKWASPEDFTSRLAMLKWGRSADGINPSWAVVNGFGDLDSDLAIGALLAEGLAPIDTVSGLFGSFAPDGFRSRWFLAGAARPDLLPGPRRSGRVGIWFSSATRDFVDYPEAGGRAGTYVTAVPPFEDDGWWTEDASDGCGLVPHLGEWRGAAHALTRLGIPYKPLLAGSMIPPDIEGLDAIWLPHVRALSDREIDLLSRFVSEGGFLFATGALPGEIDRFGRTRRRNPMNAVFGVRKDERVLDHVERYGKGLAVFRLEDLGADTLESVSGPDEAGIALPVIERWFRTRTRGHVRIKGPKWIHVEESRVSDTFHTLYIVNFNGLEMPLRRDPALVEILFDAPDGTKLVDVEGLHWGGGKGGVGFTKVADRTWSIRLGMGAFAILGLRLEPETGGRASYDYAPPAFADFVRESAAMNGFRFILDRMRNPVLPSPLNFGVRSRIPFGKTVSSRDMGLFLRTAACLDMPREWDQAYRYVEDVMTSREFGTPVGQVRASDGRPVLEQSVFGGTWNESDSPVDGLRMIRGIADGMDRFDRPAARGLTASILNGMYWTDLIRREEMGALGFPGYPGGLIGASWKWEGIDDDSLEPVARASGQGDTDKDIVPLENQDLTAVSIGAASDPAWRDVLESAVDFLLDGEVAEYGVATGLFWGGRDGFSGAFTGDYESQDSIHGRHLKTEQVARTALHLARASRLGEALVDGTHRRLAFEAASRTLRFFRIFHDSVGRIPEYLTSDGADVPDCLRDRLPLCLYHGIDNHFHGDVRIYSIIARLALEMGDSEFAAHLIEEHVLPDRDADPSSPWFGRFGESTAIPGSASATDVLESVLTLCLEARSRQGP